MANFDADAGRRPADNEHAVSGPRRTRNHVLEDISRRAFEAALPDEWVVRSIPKDYGIDTEVEVFENGQSTGSIFKVQLKSTETIKTQAPSQKISIGHLSYWLKLDVPVMIALFVKSTGAFYYRWASSHDPGIGGWSKQTTTVKYLGRDDEIDGRASDIRDEVMLLRELRLKRLPRPLPVRLSCKIATISNSKFIHQFRKKLREAQLDDAINVVVDAQSPALLIEATKNHLKIANPLNTGSFTAHATPEVPVAEDEEQLTGNALVLLAAFLSSNENANQAAEILEHDLLGGVIWNGLEVASLLAMGLGASRRPDLALEYVAACFSIHGIACYELVQTYLAPVLVLANDLEEHLRPPLISLMLAVVEAALEAGEREIAGQVYFNLGRIFRISNEPIGAMAHYNLAQEYRPEYRLSSDYWGIYGGAQFRAGNYRGSSESYAKAWQLDGGVNHALLPEYADALLFAGKFEECEDLLDGRQYPGRFGRLLNVNRIAVRQIRRVTGLSSQDRVPELDELASNLNEEAVVELLRHTDALDPRLWQALFEINGEQSAELAVTVARLWTKSAAAWATAAVLVFQSDQRSELLTSVLQTGLVDAPDEFDQALSAAASERLSSAQVSELLNLLDDVSGSWDQERRPPFRQLDDRSDGVG